MHIVYVLKSERDGKFYVGCTSDLVRRLQQHASGHVRSTKSRIPFQLIYREEFEDRYVAFRRERFFKTAKGKRELNERINHSGIV